MPKESECAKTSYAYTKLKVNSYLSSRLPGWHFKRSFVPAVMTECKSILGL